MIQYTKSFGLFSRPRYIALCVYSEDYSRVFKKVIVDEGHTSKSQLKDYLEKHYNKGYANKSHSISKLEWHKIILKPKGEVPPNLLKELESKRLSLESNHRDHIKNSSSIKLTRSDISNKSILAQKLIGKSWFNDLKDSYNSDIYPEDPINISFEDWVNRCKVSTNLPDSISISSGSHDIDILYGGWILAKLYEDKGTYYVLDIEEQRW